MVDPTGYTALDLIGFTDKGDYNPLSTYLKNDLANFNGTKWRCKVDDTTGVTPSEGLTWTAFMVLPTDHTMDMIAPIETSPSANAYVTGKQLIFNEVLYDVIDDIAIGDTLEVGVNINTSDTIVEQIEDANGAIQQLTENIAPVEGATSLHAYVVGEQLIYNDTLYKVIAPIAVNDALVVDTNIEVSPKTVIEQVEDNASDISDLNDEFYDAWKENGAYNLCPNKGTTQIVQGVTVTVNANLTLSTSGTASANGYFDIFPKSTALFLEKGKTYKLIDGTENDATVDGVQIFFYDSTNTSLGFYGKGDIFTVPNNTYYIYVALRIQNTVDFSGKVFKPLITSDLNATAADYVPHAMTNRELTPQVLYNQNDIYICKQGKIVVAQFFQAKPNNIASLNFASLGAKPVKKTSTFQCRCDSKPTIVDLNANGTVDTLGYYASYGSTYTDLKSDTSKNVFGSICFVSE